jgi:hypothetical protein
VPYKKNDNAHIENKNGSVIRRFAGYYRYDTTIEVNILNNLYANVRLFVNYFLPTKKIIGHTKDKSKRTKPIYDNPKTPYQRLLDAPGLSDFYKERLKKEYESIDLAQVTDNIKNYQQNLTRAKQRKNLKNQTIALNDEEIELF